MRLKINDSEIVWPGRVRKKPEGFFIPTHLKVLTIEEKPFVYVRKLTDDESDCEADEIPCPHFNVTDGNGMNLLNDSGWCAFSQCLQGMFSPDIYCAN